MAIIRHKTSKNACYADVLDYYKFKHAEDERTGHYEPILDEYGLMIERERYAVAYVTAQGKEADPELWASACMRANRLFGKNMNATDRKSHEYIISHPAEDRVHMSDEDLLEEGRALAKMFLRGYETLIAVHRDTDNDHLHISINSVRTLSRKQEEAWMMRDERGKVLACELQAGGKHQDSPALRLAMNDWLLTYTRAHGLIAKDNNMIAEMHRIERHGSKNNQMKKAVIDAASRSKDMEEFQRRMRADYGMDVKVSGTGKTVSVLYPGNTKYVRLRTLGLELETVIQCFAGAIDGSLSFDSDEARNARSAAETERCLSEEETRRQKREYYSNPKFVSSRTGRRYGVRFYDEHGRTMNSLEVMFRLAIIVLWQEDGLWIPSTIPPDKINEVCYATTDWKVQTMLDAIQIAREEGIHSEKEIEEHIVSISSAYEIAKADKSNTKEAVELCERLREKYRRLKKLERSTKLAQSTRYCYGPEYVIPDKEELAR